MKKLHCWAQYGWLEFKRSPSPKQAFHKVTESVRCSIKNVHVRRELIFNWLHPRITVHNLNRNELFKACSSTKSWLCTCSRCCMIIRMKVETNYSFRYVLMVNFCIDSHSQQLFNGSIIYLADRMEYRAIQFRSVIWFTLLNEIICFRLKGEKHDETV